ncbi:hypothetical protein DSO57_1023235 [Entomophthora muscae]|uniref:Uncharacterized protein n=1 Tax=Entomophthora muscae TaxID=34485 RepID=A0ACC2UPZ3_9FUNG|nr:hypothetical protein DSO57_1023235 [Entomophthora muscae]
MDMEPPVTPKPMPASAAKLPLDHTNKLFGIHQSFGGPCPSSPQPASSQTLASRPVRVGSLAHPYVMDVHHNPVEGPLDHWPLA